MEFDDEKWHAFIHAYHSGTRTHTGTTVLDRLEDPNSNPNPPNWKCALKSGQLQLNRAPSSDNLFAIGKKF